MAGLGLVSLWPDRRGARGAPAAGVWGGGNARSLAAREPAGVAGRFAFATGEESGPTARSRGNGFRRGGFGAFGAGGQRVGRQTSARRGSRKGARRLSADVGVDN